MNIAIVLIILLVGAILSYFSGNRFALKVSILFSIFAAIFSIAILSRYGIEGHNLSIDWITNPNINFALKADGLSISMVLLTTILLPLILLTSTAAELKNEKYFYSLVLFMAFAMVGAFLASDALLYYVFWEMSLIPIYFLTMLWGTGDLEKRRSTTITFFIYTFAGSLFMLAAIIYLYTKAGSFALEDFYAVQLSSTEQLWIFGAFFLAYAIKIPIFPFHTWQANMYQKAPTVGTMLLAGLMSKMGAYSILRWQLPVTPEAALQLRPIVLVLCIVGVIYGAILALRQDNLKRFFAYASLSHVGLVAAGAYALTLEGLQGSIALIIAHGFTIVGLFFATDIIARRTGTISMKQLGGIKNTAPKFTIAFFICLIASVSIPISYNFIGEMGILLGLFKVNLWYALFAGTSLFLGAFYILRMYQFTILGESPVKTKFRDLSHTEIIIFTLLIAVIIGLGIYSIPVAELVNPSLQGILSYLK